MQRRIINNKVTTNLIFGLLVALTSAAFADGSIRQGQTYPILLAGNQTNPWALPPEPEEQQPKFRQRLWERYGQYQDDQKTSTDEVRSDDVRPNSARLNEVRPGTGSRFVTPETLESIKQQQMRQQGVQMYSQDPRLPGANYNHRVVPLQRMSELPLPDYYGNTPRYGSYPRSSMGYTNPLYDVPAVSPWGNGADMLYRGEEFPWLPGTALGGLPPIPASPYIGNNDGVYTNESTQPAQNTLNPEQDKVFNPFTFAPNRNW